MKQGLLLLLCVLGAVAAQGHGLAARSHPSRRTAREAFNMIDWNNVTDKLLAQFTKQILEQNLDEVPIPNLNEAFEKNILGKLAIRLYFEAADGYLKGISTVHRAGNVTMSGSGHMTLTAPLRFGSIKIRYGHYSARWGKVGPNGRIYADVMDNYLVLRVRIDVNDQGCNIVHEDVEMVTLGGLKLKVTGLGPFNWFASKISTYIAKSLKHDIMSGLQRLLDTQLTKILSNTVLDCTSS